MSYTKQTHVAGQKLTAAQLNHMENGIIAAQNAYNLLDNSDFKNPVNQRGLSSTTTSQTYIIDRWVTDIANNAATVSINSNGITCASTSANYAGIRQNFAKYLEMAGKTYTFAVCVGGVWEATTFVMGQHAGGSLLSNGTSFFSVEQGHVIIRSVNGATITFEKVALYEGFYTTETLPTYVPKGYGAELAECQRYLRVLPELTLIFSSALQNGLYNTNAIYFDRLRDNLTPSVSWLDYFTGGGTGAFGVVQGVSYVTINDVTAMVYPDRIYFTTTKSYGGHAFEIKRCVLSAEL